MYFTLFNNSFTRIPDRFLTVSRWGVRVVWLAYTIFLFVMTHITIPQPVSHVTSGWDKPIHLGAYFVLAVLTAAVCVKGNPLRISHKVLLPSLMLFAAFDEILQGPFNRHPDFRDWLSDCGGIILGLLFFQAVLWILNHPAVPIQFDFKRHPANKRTSANASGFAR